MSRQDLHLETVRNFYIPQVTLNDVRDHFFRIQEDDSYMKEYVNDQEGEIYAIEYQKIKE